jgi:hypothetical protein
MLEKEYYFMDVWRWSDSERHNLSHSHEVHSHRRKAQCNGTSADALFARLIGGSPKRVIAVKYLGRA